MELRGQIADILRPWMSERLDEADLLDQADAILAIPEIRDALETVTAVRRQGMKLNDGFVGTEYRPSAQP